MSVNIENIVEINNSLNTFKEFKTEMQNVMEEKFDEKIGTDITTYPEIIRNVELGETIIDIAGNVNYLFSHPSLLTQKYNIHDCTVSNLLHYISQSIDFEEIKEPILLDFYNNNITYNNSSSNLPFNINNKTYRTEMNNEGLKRIFKLRNIPTTGLAYFLAGLDVSGDKVNIEFDQDYLENNTFNLTQALVRVENDITEFPQFLYKILPYASSIERINYISPTNYKAFELIGQEITLEFAKLQKTKFNYNYSNFNYFKADTVNIILHNDLEVINKVGLFGGTSNIKNLNVVGGDNDGKYIYKKNTAESEAAAIAGLDGYCQVENLKICLKAPSQTDANYFSFANITNSVQILEGSCIGTLINLPYTTQESWINFFNNLPTATAGYKNTINIAADYYNLLSEEDLLIPADKGYTIASV